MIGKVAANLNINFFRSLKCFTKFRQNAIKIEHTTCKVCSYRVTFIRKHGKTGGPREFSLNFRGLAGAEGCNSCTTRQELSK